MRRVDRHRRRLRSVWLWTSVLPSVGKTGTRTLSASGDNDDGVPVAPQLRSGERTLANPVTITGNVLAFWVGLAGDRLSCQRRISPDAYLSRRRSTKYTLHKCIYGCGQGAAPSMPASTHNPITRTRGRNGQARADYLKWGTRITTNIIIPQAFAWRIASNQIVPRASNIDQCWR